LLSLVSVISASLIASSAAASVDSTRESVSSAAAIEQIAATATRYVGTRYRLGGTTPRAFDCSGFVRYVFRRHGVELPRTAREQADVGHLVVVGLDSLRVGDLLFFRTPRGRASHVAIYLGDGQIIHASSGSRRVRYDDLASPRGRWFIEHLSGVRRILDAPVVETTEPGPGSRESRIRAGA
jgi:cell wall-associated NlpC family hydrolase